MNKYSLFGRTALQQNPGSRTLLRGSRGRYAGYSETAFCGPVNYSSLPCYAVSACGADGYRQRIGGHRAHLQHNRMARNKRQSLLSDDKIHVIDVRVELRFPQGSLLDESRGQLRVRREDGLLAADLGGVPGHKAALCAVSEALLDL